MDTLLAWINPVMYLAGLVVALWAYTVSRKRGFILVALYFLLAVVSLTAIPAINQARYRHWQAEHSAASAAYEAYFQELKTLEEKYLQPRPDVAGDITIPIPLGTAILVVALWVLGREARKEVELNSSGNAPPRASA